MFKNSLLLILPVFALTVGVSRLVQADEWGSMPSMTPVWGSGPIDWPVVGDGGNGSSEVGDQGGDFTVLDGPGMCNNVMICDNDGDCHSVC